MLVGLLLVALLSWVPQNGGAVLGQGGLLGSLWPHTICPEGQLCVAFLDVGQGDAIFIQSPTGTQILIDGGRDSAVLRELGAVMGPVDRSIDYVLATHPDLDHIGGLVGVLDRYAVATVIRTDNESDTPAWQAFETAIEAEGSFISYARRGMQYDLGDGAVLEVLFPDTDMATAESNTSSIVTQLRYGDTSVLLTGDSPKNIEEYLVLTEGEHLTSDVLKVGHHGSRTSTSELFLNEVNPMYAVISAGKDNSYGHPHVEVTDMLFNAQVTTLNTATQGRIIFVSGGTEIKPLK